MSAVRALCLLLGWSLLTLPVSAQSDDPYQARESRTEWFRDARFGMFIHWGVYAIPARGEWVRNQERLSLAEYQPYVDAFDPVDYDPRAWAKAAKAAGMKYAVMTAKHHDGFCLFDSKHTDYKATNTPAGRDLVREFIDAFRAEGLKVGLYYSLIDWHHPEYPNVGNHPMKGHPDWEGKTFDWDQYVTYMHQQVEELVTNYGKIDILWFDYSFGEYRGEKWRATELVEMARGHQPHILIDNRLGGDMEAEGLSPYAGDFEGPEQIIPPKPILDELGRPVPWEACITLNNHWGYSPGTDYKSARNVIHALVNCVSKGGNLLLNVGPDARGRIPAKSLAVLSEVGAWMELNNQSIYGCGPAPLAKPEWGYFTFDPQKQKLYAHITGSNIGQYYLPGLKGKLGAAKALADGREVFIAPFWQGERSYLAEDDTFFNLGNPKQWTFILPDERDTVVEFEWRE